MSGSRILESRISIVSSLPLALATVEELLDSTQWDVLDPLVPWVEKGVPPTKLFGVSPVTSRSQPICKYLLVTRWDGVNNSSSASAYISEEPYE